MDIKLNNLINHFITLMTSALLFLFSLSYIVPFFYSKNTEFSGIVIFISGVLYMAASILLLLEFFNVRITIIRNKIWIPIFLVGFLPKIIYFILAIFLTR
jgi:hypothetical protein